MKIIRRRSPLFLASTFATLLGTLAVLGLSAPGCGSSSGGSGSGGAAGQSAVGGHGSGGAAGGSSGSVGGAGGSIAGGGTAGQTGAAGETGGGGAAGSDASTTGGSGGGVPAGGGGAGGTAPSATGGVGGGGGTTAGNGGAAGGSSGTPGKVGVVALTESTMMYVIPEIGATTIIASGAAATYSVVTTPSSGCPTTTAGACQLYTACSTSGSSTTVSAGTVTVTGLATSPFTLGTVAQTGGYVSTAYTSYLWTTAVPATVTVGGSANVPAYDMTINTPNPITLTAPVASNSGPSGPSYIFPKSSDLVVTWTGGVQGLVVIGVSSTGTPGQTVSCSVAASVGTVTIPASLLSGLGTTGGFSASVSTSATKMVNDWLMEFQATTGAAVGTVTFTN